MTDVRLKYEDEDLGVTPVNDGEEFNKAIYAADFKYI
jgi:hypothetical protein